MEVDLERERPPEDAGEVTPRALAHLRPRRIDLPPQPARLVGEIAGLTEPDPSYHGVVFADLGAPAYALKARVQLLRDLGSAAAPFNSFLIAQGLETLSLRVERHVSNAQKVAEYLEAHPDVLSVNYAGLPSSPWYELGRKLAPKGTGAVLSFELTGGIEAGKAFVNALTLHSHVANIGDVRSLVIHPASTTHQQLTAEEQLASGVTPGLVRLAVGIEGIEDILADLEQGFAAAGSVGVPTERRPWCDDYRRARV